MEGPFSKGFSWKMGDKFWEENLLRGCSAWGINDRIIMPRVKEFSLGEQVRTALKFTLGKGMGFSLYVILLCWNIVTGYCKRFYRIPPLPKFLLFHLFCIYWDWQGQECKSECPEICDINYIVTVISACTHSCGIYKHLCPQPNKNTFIATENP